MVRLKAGQGPVRRGLPAVSIPYGTIKSQVPWSVIMPNTVSIPYGTIKSLPGVRRAGVRHVSIPYGTIKSLPPRTPRLLLPGFNSIWYD